MTTSSTTPRVGNRVTLLEVVLLIVILGITLTLLFPSLSASREQARENLCRRNLRRLDLATAEYVLHQRRLPDAVTWPIDLLPNLEENAGTEKSKFGQDVFSSPRPGLLTCPSHRSLEMAAQNAETGHYVLIVDRTTRVASQDLTWRFRDRELRIPDDARQPWCVGSELSPAAAAQQLESTTGPHAGGSFNESDAKGNVINVGPAAAR